MSGDKNIKQFGSRNLGHPGVAGIGTDCSTAL